MKRMVHVVAASALVLGGGCTSASNDKPAVAIANPASEYCAKLGGKSVIVRHADGSERGDCHLPDGSRIDEWELFRRDNGPK